MRRRLLYGAAFALTVAVAFIVATVCFPLCAIWTPSDPQWYLFFCELCGA